MLDTEDRMLDTEDRMLGTEDRMLDTEDRMLDTEDIILDTEDIMLDTEDRMLDNTASNIKFVSGCLASDIWKRWYREFQKESFNYASLQQKQHSRRDGQKIFNENIKIK